jgi:hypothetical protein
MLRAALAAVNNGDLQFARLILQIAKRFSSPSSPADLEMPAVGMTRWRQTDLLPKNSS